MALVDLLSFQIQDYVGDVKSVPVYIPSGETVANLQTIADLLGPEIDAAIDGKVIGISVTLALAVNGTIKGSPTAGNTVHEGALLTFSATDTEDVYSVYIPSWENAGFTGNVANTGGVYTTLTDDLVQNANRHGDLLVAYLRGKRTFRK